MDFHLDYGLRLQTEPEYKNLYGWAINEVDAKGHTGRDQIPWPWTLLFSVTDCVRTDQVEITDYTNQPTVSQSILMTLRPTRWRGDQNGGVYYSMFGTSRTIMAFSLQVLSLKDETDVEVCRAWGTVSYTTEVDFRNQTEDDCICFYLYVKPSTFNRYVNIVDQGAIDSAVFSVGGVHGFYSEWSPSISTDHVKVLVPGGEHAIDIPQDFHDEVPRLGQVREARLQLNRKLIFPNEPIDKEH